MSIIWIFLTLFSTCFSVHATIRVGSVLESVLVDDSDGHYLKYVRYFTVPDEKRNGVVWIAGDNIDAKTVAEVQAIVTAIKQLETDRVRKEIFNKMNSADEPFRFSSADYGDKAVKMRLEAMKKLDDMNLRKFYYYGSPPYKTQTVRWKPADFKRKYFWKQKSNSGTAFDAITELCDGGKKTDGECYGALVACVWWGSAQAVEEDEFNQMHPSSALDMNTFFKDPGNIGHSYLSQDTTTLVPGDWIYMKNYNYSNAIHFEENKEFWDKKWLEGTTYPWSGENCFYRGTWDGVKHFGGLGEGLGSLTEAQMREELRTAYNRDLKKVIDNNGVLKVFDKTQQKMVDGDMVTEIKAGADAEDKIKLVNHRRIFNVRLGL